MGVKTFIIRFIRVIRGRLFKHQRFSDTLRAPQNSFSCKSLPLTSYLLPKPRRKDTNNQQIGKLTNYPYFCTLKQTEECEQDQ